MALLSCCLATTLATAGPLDAGDSTCPVVPRPLTYHTTGGEPFCLTAKTIIAADEALLPQAEWLSQALAAPTGWDLAVRTGSKGQICLRIDTVAVPKPEGDHVYLTAGENTLYCGAARLTLSGWDIIFMGEAIACTDGESVHTGSWCPSALNIIFGQEIVFGRVDDPNIALLTIEEWGGRDWTKPGCENEKLRRLCTVTVEEFIEDGGCRYFLLDAREREENRSYAADKGVLRITGYDASHREILRCEAVIGENGLL